MMMVASSQAHIPLSRAKQLGNPDDTSDAAMIGGLVASS
jgi:hypothetical protein